MSLLDSPRITSQSLWIRNAIFYSRRTNAMTEPKLPAKHLGTAAHKHWGRVDASTVDVCWEWLGPVSHKGGYAMTRHDGKNIGAHRLSWILTRGPIPSGLVVRHVCDNPRCCNPCHLDIGTHYDNVQDMINRGRRVASAARGVRNCKAKLTDNEVRRIRAEYAEGNTSTIKLAKRYGVSQGLISQIVLKRIWKHVL